MKFTDYVAIYGAILSTSVFLWNLRNATSRMKVSIVPGVNGSGEEMRSGVYISIKNPSPHTIHVTSATLLCPMRRTTFWDTIKYSFKYRRLFLYPNWVHTHLSLLKIETSLPKSIEARNSHMIFISDEKINEVLNRENTSSLAACVQDALWRSKYSKPYLHSR